MNEEADIVWALKEGLSVEAPRLYTWRITSILNPPIHRTVGKGADVYEHKQNY
jgi:hypothetical protein